jgi:outer membrane protein assembly factor BamA
MKHRIWLFIPILAVFFLCPPLSLPAQQAQDKTDAVPQKASSFVVLPVVYYSPETRWAGGIGGLCTFRLRGTEPQSRPSALSFIVLYTQNEQFTISAKPEIYLNNEMYFLTGNFEISRYPNKFFGIGNDTPDSFEEGFTPHQVSLEAALWKKIVPRHGIYAGLVYNFDHYSFDEFDPAGRLVTRAIPGSRGGTSSGFGLLFKWDDRDNVFTPSRGRQFSLSASLYNSLFASDFNYAKILLDLRQFFPMFGSHVLAVQGVLRTMAGTVPFIVLPKIGSDSIMRGYYSGRYRDKTMAAVQAEYRFPVWWRFGLVAFGGFGDVAKDLAHLAPGRFKLSGGWGIRFKVNPKEGATLRLDFGFGKGFSGMYLTAGESF